MAVATEQLTPFDHSHVVMYLQTTRDEKCRCWRENHAVAVNDMAVSSWVLLSLAKMQATPERDELKLVLNTQKPDGSWAIIPDGNYPRDSAIYATSWALLVLDEYRRKHGVPAGRENAVDQGIGVGVQYLISVRLSDQARWLDYPHSEDASRGVFAVADDALVGVECEPCVQFPFLGSPEMRKWSGSLVFWSTR
jgi:hypothetical protein